jgi:hypothetical protein
MGQEMDRPLGLLLPAPQLSAEAEQELTELVEQRMLAPARKAGYELRLVGATVLPQQQTITRTQHGTWAFVDHLEDPTAAEYNGEIPVPEDQIPWLIELGRRGVKPQFIWIGHQLPDSYRDGEPLPQLVPDPRPLRELDERLTLQLAKALRVYLKGVLILLGMAASAPLVVVGGAATAVGVGLDPIIFGGVKHPQLPVVMWCALAQWDWE